MKIATIVGARPQFIKAAVVSRELRTHQNCVEALIHTGQHYDDKMSGVFFREMGIPRPDHQLNVGSGRHGKQTARMLEQIESVLLMEKPDVVLVYGDTNSTLAGALAAVKLHIPIAHVEAGVRSFNRRMPEEINRILTDHSSQWLLAPTRQARENLLNEGVADEKIQVVGDVMFDATIHYKEVGQKSAIVKEAGVESKMYVLATIHRAENTDDPRRLKAIFEAFFALAKEVPIVLPIHPRTSNALRREGLLTRAKSSLKLIEPVGYLDMLQLESHSRLIATDSGGVQKEAYFCGVPCATLREETEWKELVALGWNRLISLEDAVTTLAELRRALTDPPPGSNNDTPFGNGTASKTVVDAVTQGANGLGIAAA